MKLLPFLLRSIPWLLACLLLLILISSVPAFGRLRYWLSLAPQYFAVAALAIALTPIVLTGGIDLSIGSIAVLSSVVIGVLYRDMGLPIGVALAGGIVAGLLCGVINGLLVRSGVLPLVATLATRELFRGLAWSLSGDNPVTQFPIVLAQIWNTPILGLPVSLWGILLLWCVAYVLVHHSWAGRYLLALGDNQEAARFAALPVGRLQLGIYAASGFVAGLCGVGLILKYGAAKADAEQSLELLAIACVVMGGVRITGGAGHLGGTFLGILTVCALLAGLSGTASTWRDTITGAVLIGVAVLSESGARYAARLEAHWLQQTTERDS